MLELFLVVTLILGGIVSVAAFMLLNQLEQERGRSRGLQEELHRLVHRPRDRQGRFIGLIESERANVL